MSRPQIYVKSVRPKTFGTQGRARAAQAKVRKVRASWKAPVQRRASREEVKYYDTTLVAGAPPAATDAAGGEMNPSAVSLISTPAQGDGDQNRDGKQIFIKNATIKGVVSRAATEDAVNPPGPEKVIVYLVLDTQTNALAMNSEDCFKNLGASAQTACAMLRNLSANKRFRILKEETFDLDATGVSVEGDNLHSTPGTSKVLNWFVPIDMEVNFNTVTPTVNTVLSVVDNSLHVIAFSQGNSATLNYNARIRFTE